MYQEGEILTKEEFQQYHSTFAFFGRMVTLTLYEHFSGREIKVDTIIGRNFSSLEIDGFEILSVRLGKYDWESIIT